MYYFTSEKSILIIIFYIFYIYLDPAYIMYMGKDKFENEELIKYGWPEDIWFHVDKLSSAHVYLRIPYNTSFDDISDEMIQECSQLVKANSIDGVKLKDVEVVYLF